MFGSSGVQNCDKCKNHRGEVNVTSLFRPFKFCLCTSCFVKETMAELDRQFAFEQRCKGVQTMSYCDVDCDIDVSEGSLSKDLAKLLDTNANQDTELKCGEHLIKAHKIVLCARSEVFKAMLRSDMLEGRTGKVEINDIDECCFQDFIRYLYTDELPELTFDKAVILFSISDRFAVQSLMDRCSAYLLNNLSLENSGECLSLADKHLDENLKNGIQAYILDKNMYLPNELQVPLNENCPEFATEELMRTLCRRDRCVQTDLCWSVDGSRGSLSSDFSNLLDSDVSYDVEIKCREHSIKAHKIILCARSDEFNTMIKSAEEGKLQSNVLNGTNDTNAVVVEVRDMEFNYLQYFIRYLYTDTLPELTLERALMFYEIGQVFGVRNIMRRCCMHFQKNCPVETTGDIRLPLKNQDSLIGLVLSLGDPDWQLG